MNWKYTLEYIWDTIKFLVFIAAIGWFTWFIFWYTPDPKLAVQEKAIQVQRETPRIIRNVDGCQVYQFEANDRIHYFTRCASGTTETETQQYCGKNCSYTETIATQNFKNSK